MHESPQGPRRRAPVLGPPALAVRHLPELTPDVTVWIRWALAAGLDPLVAAYLRWQPHYLLDETPASSLEARCSPRTWESVSNILGLDLPEAIKQKMLNNAITPGVAVAFRAFLRVYRELPSIDVIRMDPTGAALPERLDIGYATIVHLAAATTEGDFPVVSRYVDRLPPELQWLYMVTLTKRLPAVTTTPTYIRWATSDAAQIS